MAIKEFTIGPQNYFEEGYFDGDYTQSNVAKFFLECDIDNIKGGRFITGEYYEDNYIDGTYYHNNQIQANLTCDAIVVQVVQASLGGYYEAGYLTTGYYRQSGSFFTLECRLGEDVFANGLLEASASVVIDVINIKQANCTLEATASQSTTAKRTVDIALALNSSFTQSSTISHTHGADLVALGEAVMAATAQSLLDSESQPFSFFTVAAFITLKKGVLADADAEFIINSAVNKNAVFDINAEAAFSVSASPDKLQFAEITINSEFACSATAISYQLRIRTPITPKPQNPLILS
jgi:hypothetical protein